VNLVNQQFFYLNYAPQRAPRAVSRSSSIKTMAASLSENQFEPEFIKPGGWL